MKFKECLLPVAMLAFITIGRMPSNADDRPADVYQTDQLNTKQETKTVNIISILPAKVCGRQLRIKANAQPFGALIRRSRWRCYRPQRRFWQRFGTTAGQLAAELSARQRVVW